LPPNPVLPPNLVLPPNPIKPFGIGLQFDPVFSAAGVLDFNASTVQVIPHYDFSDPDKKYNSLQLANFESSLDTNISVEIGGVLRGTYAIAAGSSQNVTFPGGWVDRWWSAVTMEPGSSSPCTS